MNALFGSLSTEGLEESTDRLGGFQPLETDAYTATIKMAYAGQSSGGARNVTLELDLGGRSYRETIYITKKTGENYFVKDGKKVPLPGFTTIDDLCMVTVGKPLAEMIGEDKVVNIYDYDAKKELPTTVPMLTELLGQVATFGIVKNLENKSESDGNGGYTTIADTRDTNTIEKVFHTETKMTVVEARQGADEARFFESWVDRNKGKTRDRREIKDGQGVQTGRPGASKTAPQAGNKAPGKSLFAKTA